jgi:hypothetical protein
MILDEPPRMLGFDAAGLGEARKPSLLARAR